MRREEEFGNRLGTTLNRQVGNANTETVWAARSVNLNVFIILIFWTTFPLLHNITATQSGPSTMQFVQTKQLSDFSIWKCQLARDLWTTWHISNKTIGRQQPNHNYKRSQWNLHAQYTRGSIADLRRSINQFTISFSMINTHSVQGFKWYSCEIWKCANGRRTSRWERHIFGKEERFRCRSARLCSSARGFHHARLYPVPGLSEEEMVRNAYTLVYRKSAWT